MGSVFSLSYDNIFMGSFETKYIYPHIRGKCKFYPQYIDIFMIWNGTGNELKDFFKDINTVYNSIKFEPAYSIDSINFLDTFVYKDKNYNLQTKLYCKPTDRTHTTILSILHLPRKA